jgi:hypothetical protein
MQRYSLATIAAASTAWIGEKRIGENDLDSVLIG